MRCLITGIVMTAIAGASGSAALEPDASATSPTVEQWTSQELTSLKPMTSVLLGLLATTSAWQSTGKSELSVASQITAALPNFRTTIEELSRLPVLTGAPGARTRDLAGAELYALAFRIELVAAALPAGEVQSQLEVSFERIRDLGDRVYDQGTALITALGPAPTTNPNVEVVAPQPVPNWPSLGLTAGPPLAPSRVPAIDEKPARTQPMGSWRSDVDRDGVPDGQEELKGLKTMSPGQAVAISDQFQAAASRISTQPRPKGQKSLWAVTELSFLIDEEAVRAHVAALLEPTQSQALNQEGEALALVGESLWAGAELGRRSIGLRGNARNLTLSLIQSS
jgi:hypothetical protein